MVLPPEGPEHAASCVLTCKGHVWLLVPHFLPHELAMYAMKADLQRRVFEGDTLYHPRHRDLASSDIGIATVRIVAGTPEARLTDVHEYGFSRGRVRTQPRTSRALSPA